MEFFMVATAHFLALLSPGPDFFLILQAALRLPLRYAISVCAGIAAANGVYLIAAVLGLETVREMSGLMTVLRLLGGGYLIYIGVLLLRAPPRPFDAGDPGMVLHVTGIGRQFAVGFLTAILNPKNAIFYLSLFTVMVEVETGLEIRILYALWMVGVVFVWDVIVAMAVGNARAKRLLGQWAFRIEKLSGVLLAGFGIILVLG
jgi:threonine/homoserine/homoserine lactone efflux protein